MIENCGPVSNHNSIYLLTCSPKPDNSLLNLVREAFCFYGLEDTKTFLFEDFNLNSNADMLFLDISDLNQAMFDSLKNFIYSARKQNISITISGFYWSNNIHQRLLKDLFLNDSVFLAKQNSSNGIYLVHSNTSFITGVLAGTNIPHRWKESDDSSYFIKRGNEVLPIISGYDHRGSICPYLIQRNDNGPPLFFLSKTNIYNTEDSNPSLVCPSILSALLLVRKFAGPKCWHNDDYVANFTIDDPNLIEPYGNLSYRSLLAAMKKLNFHTTIAFIPWNYARIKKKVVDMFAAYPNLFSLAIHGNDHDGYEFSSAKPLEHQKESISEALLRMRLLKRKTGLDFSWVMICPHKIGTRETIELLDDYGFLASINRQIIPQNNSRPKRFSFGLRPAQDDVNYFPLCERWHPEEIIPQLQAFFGKPLLVYTHSNYFSNPLKILKESINKINQLKPKWINLECTTKNLFLKKEEDAEHTHVWMFSRIIEFNNTDFLQKQVTFYRYERNADKCKVWCNGKIYPAKIKFNCIIFRVSIQPKQTINVFIKKDLMPICPKKSKLNLRILARRYICDYRDRFWFIWRKRLKTFKTRY